MTKFLICGNDAEIINKIFSSKFEDTDFLSTTEIPQDIKSHVNIFKPDGFIYCVKGQTDEQLKRMLEGHRFLEKAADCFLVVGSDADLDIVFSKLGAIKIQETIPKEIGVNSVIERISKIISEISFAKVKNYDFSVVENAEPSNSTVNNFDLNVLEHATSHANNNDIQIINKKKIMVVDDDPNVLRTIRNFLQDKYIISVASSGRIALRFLEEKVVDLILLDYMMPDMDGRDVLNYIRQSVLTRKIPVVFLTGLSDRDKIRELLGMGIQGYLLKPIDQEKLLDCIKKTLATIAEE